jgi:hypothetical protein
MNKFKKVMVCIVTISALSTPMWAHATISDLPWLTVTQIKNLALWAKDKADMLYQMAKNQAETMSAFGSTQTVINEGMDSSSSTISATIEKQTGAMKELTQAKMNYDATLETSKAAAEAEDKFGNPAELANMCDTAATGQQAAIASNSAAINGKALNAALTRRQLHSPAPAVVTKQLIDEHNNSYCSDDDQAHGRCNTAASIPKTQQNADLNAGSLLTPSNGSTYSNTEREAAQKFIVMASGPVPPENLPPALEKTPQGKAYVLATMVAAAQSSVAKHSLSQIWAENSADPGLSETAEGNPGDALSMVGVMKKFVYDRFVEPKWKADLVGMDTNGLLKEIAVLMAGQNWMDYQAYRQAERMEAVVATQLAIAARDHNEKRLIGLRSQLSRSR